MKRALVFGEWRPDSPGRWQPIETAPKNGTWILAYGQAYPELAGRGCWVVSDIDRPRVPFQMAIKWVEVWYDKEIDAGDGMYRKERALGFSHWAPEPVAFRPTHWMPLPDPPKDRSTQ